MIATVSGALVASTAVVIAANVGSGSAAPAQTTIFGATAKPAVAAANDSNQIELGVRFSPDVAIYATGVRFYKGPGNSGEHIGTLWGSAHNALRRVAFSNETATGWQTAKFITPVKLVAHATYYVSYHAMHGHYSYTQGYFTKTINNGTVTMPGSTQTVGNGIYKYGAFAFPSTGSVKALNYWVDVSLATSIPASTTTPPTTKPTTTTAPVTPTGWPGASNTGVPAGTQLTNYTGPTTITKCGAVIDSKIVNDDITIKVGNGTRSSTTPCVVIKNSLIKGEVHNGFSSEHYGPLVLTDTEIAVPVPNDGASAALDEANWYGWRLNIHNARSNVMCDGFCALHDSWVHGNYYVNGAHMGGFLTNGNSGGAITLDHNQISCNLVNPGAENGNGGCSGDVNFYGDFSAISNVSVTGNLLDGSTDPSYCAYTGANQPEKAFPRGTNLVWRNNVWQKGVTGKCGWAGAVFDWANNAGNVWCNNLWDNKTPVLTGVTCTT